MYAQNWLIIRIFTMESQCERRTGPVLKSQLGKVDRVQLWEGQLMGLVLRERKQRCVRTAFKANLFYAPLEVKAWNVSNVAVQVSGVHRIER